MENTEATSSGENNPKPWQSYHTVYTNAKAGMEGVDKEKVQRIVYEMSKGSKYFQNEEKKEAFMRQKIENMRVQCAKLAPANLAHFQTVADRKISELEVTRDLSRIWLHVDMDAFYAAVETLSNPSLKGKPMAVGGLSMLSTANYEARRFGVRAAMPGFIARKLCPELILVPTDFKKYIHYSDLTRKVFQKYDPHFMAASLDEAYLDITDVCRDRGTTGGEIAEELRNSVYQETGLTCSAGVAANQLLAKVCSDINKPNGQFVLPNDRTAIVTFISSLPIRKIGGIGKVTEHILTDVLGIKTCEDLLQKGGFLCALFSQSTADFFLSVGLGLGRTDTPQAKFRKSISNERTFSATDNEAFLYQKLAEIAEMLSSDMQKEGLHGRTLTLKLKTASFEIRSRAVTLQKYICSSEDILKHASKLLKAELPVSLRLIGLRVSHFSEDKAEALSDPTQKTLMNFIVTGDASRKNIMGRSSLASDCSDQPFTDDIETAFSTDSREIQHDETRDSLNVQDLDGHNCTISSNIEVNTRDTVRCNTEFTSPEHTDGRNADTSNEAVLPKCKNELFWIDDYKCSFCGIEMPPDFVAERQEHSDFHFAERLQNEESSINTRTSIPRQRLVSKTDASGQSTQKKAKLSRDKSHISIDMFFTKSNQNF
ncbi:DNA polymerase kappa isoform X2 [Mercurialis annua]|uniref:DNA polymerase kappa isoform X2 n=1 Tax=Mercurialis annua TaxID=3986 RepID=UPI00215EFEE9|nr:DNA polymerase kappa isoform X2 [Mercurialis annua]